MMFSNLNFMSKIHRTWKKWNEMQWVDLCMNDREYSKVNIRLFYFCIHFLEYTMSQKTWFYMCVFISFISKSYRKNILIWMNTIYYHLSENKIEWIFAVKNWRLWKIFEPFLTSLYIAIQHFPSCFLWGRVYIGNVFANHWIIQ